MIEHLPQVHYIARRIYDRLPRHVPMDDLVHSGVVGLIEALHHFDPSKNVQLNTYAKARIQGAIIDSLRESDWGPRTLRRRARQIEQAEHALKSRLRRTPSQIELAAELGIGLNKLQQVLGELHGLEIVSLQAVSSDDGHNDERLAYVPQEVEDDPFNLCFQSELKDLLARAIGELPSRKRQVLAFYYLEEMTMKEIGARMGVGESRVSQMHSAALARLRARMRQLLETQSSQKPGSKPGIRVSTDRLRRGVVLSMPSRRGRPTKKHSGWIVAGRNLRSHPQHYQSHPEGGPSRRVRTSLSARAVYPLPQPLTLGPATASGGFEQNLPDGAP